MTEWTSAASSVLASFMASMVEFVEALTIVLAVGVVRGWRSALLGTAAALAVLVALVALLGPSLTRIPLPTVQLAVGTLLLLFGLRWLRKAILRAAGVLALHDEARAFEDETALLRGKAAAVRQAIDTLAFATSFKIVMLEGIEVVFIVIAIGASGQMMLPASLGALLALVVVVILGLWLHRPLARVPENALKFGVGVMLPASLGALLALVVVVILGLWLHRPLARVPENALKFGVGVMLSAFGTFWVGEGIGLGWPGADWAVLALIAAFLVVALVLMRLCAGLRPALGHSPKKTDVKPPRPTSRVVVIGKEILGLFIDDGWLAVGIVIWVAGVWLIEVRYVPPGSGLGALFAIGLAAVLSASAIRRARM